MLRTPTRIEPDTETHQNLLLTWNSGETFSLPYVELRFECPCAACVDEKTGKRLITREQVAPDVRPLGVEPVGRYALQIRWSDRHSTGMYHFDRLFDLCQKSGTQRN